MNKFHVMLIVGLLVGLNAVFAALPNVSLGPCYDFSTTSVDDSSVSDLVVWETCNSSNSSIDWTGSTLDLSVLGSITEGITIEKGRIEVDVNLRPDLDADAHLTFNGLSYVFEPSIYKDGVLCEASSCNNTNFNMKSGSYEFDVDGFTVYELQGRQDMAVFTDSTAYIQDYVYQTIDFGAVNDSYKCVIMIFDKDNRNLLQSNPARQRTEKDVLSISTDLVLEDNSPEYLGYFKAESGLVNAYYRKNLLIGYDTYIYVAKCHTDSGNEKIYEEEITPAYWEAFKSAPARWVWWNQNASVATWMIIFGIILLLIIILSVRSVIR